ncbi:hypothetical protein HMPREF9144_0649 [Prevotella pallens ATCC 700821]|uniref:Uncharacterized protein n=1 Tax=Prevotella pallens ATCC 700821 TaxID=997353 RepID=F9DG59_9BACT|nr:hypothetical protein HMPREF9144_0649 [Prevotella pallens ATCC 700821]
MFTLRIESKFVYSIEDYSFAHQRFTEARHLFYQSCILLS